MYQKHKANQDIRRRAEKLGLPLWELAQAVGISDTTLTKWLRMPLPLMDPRRTRLLCALDKIEREGVQHGKAEETEVDGASV